MDLSQLHYFRTAARTGNLSQAARELFVTQPNLSRSIARLETECPLRGGKRLRRAEHLHADGAAAV